MPFPKSEESMVEGEVDEGLGSRELRVAHLSAFNSSSTGGRQRETL
jgi:hypothetical protein